MVVYHVYDDCYAACMALVNEVLIFFTCTIVLVERKPVIRIISPAEVAVELLNRHELNCVHAEILDVVELGHGTLDILRCCEVTEEHLIDHEVILILNLEVLMLPCILRLVDLERGNKLLCSFRECRNTCNVLVVPLVVNDLCIRIADICVRA